ncbi:PAAR domain-containing protein [Paraburkholderia strydomiana]
MSPRRDCRSSFGARPLAYLGAPVFCNTCSAEGIIIRAPRCVEVMGRQVTLENDMCRCKCVSLPKLVPFQATGTLSP